MLIAAIIQLKALEDGVLEGATGRAVHGLWFHHWHAVDPDFAERLHSDQGARPFTLSPLMDLPHTRHGRVTIPAGTTAWFRVTTLTAALSERLLGAWLPQLPGEVHLGGMRWRMVGATTAPDAHPWAGQVAAQELAAEHLLAGRPPRRWRLTFATPTSFRSAAGHLPFPMPNALINSWLRRWQAFGPVRLPDELLEDVRQGLVVSAYRLKTVPVRDRGRVTIGCVGGLTLHATKLNPVGRAAVDLLATYAFWTGSGHHTTQGMGVTGQIPK